MISKGFKICGNVLGVFIFVGVTGFQRIEKQSSCNVNEFEVKAK